MQSSVGVNVIEFFYVRLLLNYNQTETATVLIRKLYSICFFQVFITFTIPAVAACSAHIIFHCCAHLAVTRYFGTRLFLLVEFRSK
jgi:hypothetical protein